MSKINHFTFFLYSKNLFSEVSLDIASVLAPQLIVDLLWQKHVRPASISRQSGSRLQPTAGAAEMLRQEEKSHTSTTAAGIMQTQASIEREKSSPFKLRSSQKDTAPVKRF